MLKRKNNLLLGFAGFLMLFLAACGGDTGDEVAALPTDTLAPIFSLTPRLTATPFFTRTPLPTFTPVPSETPVPPTPSNTPTMTPTQPVTGIINSLQAVNVREGPDVSFSAIRALNPGTGVEVLSQNPEGNWYNIQMDDGAEGWIFSDLVRINPSPTPFPTFTPTPDLTALALGTPLPTALIGGGTITPTPPRSAVTQTPFGTPAEDDEDEDATETDDSGPTQPFLPIIDVNSINATATALAAGVVSVISPPAPVSTGQSPNVVDTATPDAPNDADDSGFVQVVTLTPSPASGASANATPSSGFDVTPTLVGGEAITQVDPPAESTSGVTAPAPSGGSGTVQEGVDVFAMCDNRGFGVPAPTNLAPGSTIDVFWAWYVSEPRYIDEHLEAVNYEVRLGDTLLSNWREYGQRTIPAGDGYAKYWYVPMGPLDAGTYVITYRATWSRAISDGYESFGPGTANPVEEGSCTFTVG